MTASSVCLKVLSMTSVDASVSPLAVVLFACASFAFTAYALISCFLAAVITSTKVTTVVLII
jgi:hypothetical protein